MPETQAANSAAKSSESAPENGHKKLVRAILETSKTKPRQQRPRATKVLPNWRVSFMNQIKALRGFAAASGPSGKAVTSDEVASIVGLERDTVAMLNPFFASAGLIQSIREKNEAWRYMPSAEVIAFSRAHEWNPETAPHKLAPAISKTWFYDALAPKLSFTPISEDEAMSILGEKASAGPEYRRELRLLIDYMEVAGLISRDNGQLKPVKSRGSSEPPATKEERTDTVKQSAPTISQGQGQSAGRSVATAFAQPTQGVVNFHVDVKVDMTEFACWPADRITSFFNGIAQVLAAKGALEKEATKE